MQYKIFGGTLPAVTIRLDRGEGIYTESDGMTWMTDQIRMETNVRGGVLKSLGRMLTGESFFMASYDALADQQEITFASSFPGAILCLEVSEENQYICQKSAFLCAQKSVELSLATVKGLSSGLFGGEGFILQRLHGKGLAFVEIDGSLHEIDLAPGQKIKVDTGNLAVYESSVRYSVEVVKGFKNVFFGGEGLFLTVLEGPGKVWLQTMTLHKFAEKIVPFVTNDDH